MGRPLITDIDHIRRLAEEHDDEDLDFREFLKRGLDWSDDRLDALVHETYIEIANEIDCLNCANCCRRLKPQVTATDSARLAKRLGISAEEFGERYLATDESGYQVMSEVPCAFLDDNRCTVYEDRPRDCRDYPHLLKPGFRFRLWGVISNTAVCPIVFNVLEALKVRLDFESGDSRRE